MKFALLVCFLTVSFSAVGEVTVSTHHYDDGRTGNNDDESILNTSNVNAGQFGKIVTLPIDGQAYAQPLYIPNVRVNGAGTRNVLYVATMNNSLYAFDADNNHFPTVLWKTNFNKAGATPIPLFDIQRYPDISSTIGILSTPVIDVPKNTLYILVRTKENSNYLQRLHAIDIRSGAEVPNSPRIITGSVTQPGGTILAFDPKLHNQRPALALANGMVYISWASHNDLGPYHGWIMAYHIAQDGLSQSAVFSDTLTGRAGGIWQAASGPVIDRSGNLYFVVGNGDWNGVDNFGQSVIKLSPTLKILDYFTPDNWLVESNSDIDLGSGGLMLIPETNYLVTGSKQGIIYVLNTASLGRMVSGNTQVPQVFISRLGHHIHTGPAYYNSPTRGPLMYIWPENGDYMRAYHFNGTDFDTKAVMASKFPCPGGMPGGFLSLSSKNSTAKTGILWALVPYGGNANQQVVPGVLRAFDADNLSNELWNSDLNQRRDELGNFAKYVPPVVANGKVYAATFSNSIAVYGLLSGTQANIQVNAGGSQSGTFLADRYYSGGFKAQNSKQVDLSGDPIPPPSSAFLDERFGQLSYEIPGLAAFAGYTVRLHFAETYWTKTGQRKFAVMLNGQLVLSEFDIAAAAGGVNKATMKQFDTAANYAGKIILKFNKGSIDNPKVDAIEIISNGAQPTVAAINAGGSGSGVFASDRYFSGGQTASISVPVNTDAVANPAPQAVYQTERYGPSTYTIPNLTPLKQYTVRLHFVEQFWTASKQRIFTVNLNGATVLPALDIFSAVGAKKALSESFTTLALTNGTIRIDLLSGSADVPTISGIEIY